MYTHTYPFIHKHRHAHCVCGVFHSVFALDCCLFKASSVVTTRKSAIWRLSRENRTLATSLLTGRSQSPLRRLAFLSIILRRQ